MFPDPMPAKIKYGNREGSTAITTKGPAQHTPFIIFAWSGHLVLFFILFRREYHIFHLLYNKDVNEMTKLPIQITAL